MREVKHSHGERKKNNVPRWRTSHRDDGEHEAWEEGEEEKIYGYALPFQRLVPAVSSRPARTSLPHRRFWKRSPAPVMLRIGSIPHLLSLRSTPGRDPAYMLSPAHVARWRLGSRSFGAPEERASPAEVAVTVPPSCSVGAGIALARLPRRVVKNACCSGMLATWISGLAHFLGIQNYKPYVWFLLQQLNVIEGDRKLLNHYNLAFLTYPSRRVSSAVGPRSDHQSKMALTLKALALCHLRCLHFSPFLRYT